MDTFIEIILLIPQSAWLTVFGLMLTVLVSILVVKYKHRLAVNREQDKTGKENIESVRYAQFILQRQEKTLEAILNALVTTKKDYVTLTSSDQELFIDFESLALAFGESEGIEFINRLYGGDSGYRLVKLSLNKYNEFASSLKEKYGVNSYKPINHISKVENFHDNDKKNFEEHRDRLLLDSKNGLMKIKENLNDISNLLEKTSPKAS